MFNVGFHNIQYNNFNVCILIIENDYLNEGSIDSEHRYQCLWRCWEDIQLLWDQWFQRPVLLYGYYKLASNDIKVEKYPLFYCDDTRIVRNDVYYYYLFPNVYIFNVGYYRAASRPTFDLIVLIILHFGQKSYKMSYFFTIFSFF